MRQYALEKLGESGQADAVRARHRDYYSSMAALLDTPAPTGHEQRLEQAETEIDNLRAAFAWSRENSDTALASRLASSLQPLWLARGRIREGLAWFDAALADQNAHPAEVAPAVRARRSPTMPCSTYMWAPPKAWSWPAKPWRSRGKSTTPQCCPGPDRQRRNVYNPVSRAILAEAMGLARAWESPRR